MTVDALRACLGCEVCTGGDALGKEVKAGYCGDLLSWVMCRAGSGSAWVTVMGNVNAVAVAVLTDAACIILAEGAAFDPQAREKAVENGVAVLRSQLPAYELAGLIREAMAG